MSRSLELISKSILGYGAPDGRCLPCSGVSGKAVNISINSSRGNYTKLSSFRRASTVCTANSSNYRRNSDFSRQKKQGFSRNRNNRPNEERDSFEDLEESDSFSSRNGPSLSAQKFQATATPGSREKEIVELFRKVQAQLRERAAMKEERKVEDSQVKSKESETVDSLLKLLRKHSVQQGKRNINSVSNREFILDEPEKDVVPLNEEKSTRKFSGLNSIVNDKVPVPLNEEKSTKNISEPNSIVNDKVQDIPAQIPSPQLSRPKSNFRKRSPVPAIKFQPVDSDDFDDSLVSASNINLNGRKGIISVEQESDQIDNLKIEPEPESYTDTTLFLEGNGLEDLSEDEISEIDEDDVAEEENQVISYSGMKLTELRALAKSRGMKGFSKLKKNELIELLSGSST